jgi:hypothetical protein
VFPEVWRGKQSEKGETNMKKSILLLLLLTSFALSSEQCRRLLNEGWCYIAPTPKSAQARHGNYDGRTTWWVGYWKNESLKECSGTIPRYIEKQVLLN